MAFDHGFLNDENVEEIAQKIKDLLAGKKFSVASCHSFDSTEPQLRLDTGVELKADWTDNSPDPLKWGTDDSGRSFINFSAGGFYYTLDSRWQAGKTEVRNHLVKKTGTTDAYLVFYHGGFTFTGRSGSGGLGVIAFTVHGDGPVRGR